jgi:hypothetical protein
MEMSSQVQAPVAFTEQRTSDKHWAVIRIGLSASVGAQKKKIFGP